MTPRALAPLDPGEVDRALQKILAEYFTEHTCSSCGRKRRITEMSRDRWRKVGYRRQCRECRAAYDRQRYLSVRDITDRGIAWAADHRRRMRKYGLDLVTDSLTEKDIVSKWGSRCVHCGVGPFEEIDHVIPVAAGGSHTIGNTVPSCHECNRKKYWSFDRSIIADHRERWALDHA